jgi:bacterioferritin (cytochrome b1)
MRKLSEHNRARVIDLLCERLAFERSGVRLYDRVIAAMQGSADSELHAMQATMEEHRAEEKEHEEWLEAQIRALGGDASAQTEGSRLVSREAAGLEEVAANDAADLQHLMHALLAAEAVDNAGWELLVELAEDVNDRDARREFTRRLHHEREHLAFVRHVMERLAVRAIFGDRSAQERALDLAASIPP